MSSVDEMISKSLEDIDNIVTDINKSRAAAQEADALSKAVPNEDPAPEDVAQEGGQAPEQDPEAQGEQDGPEQDDETDTDSDNEGEEDSDDEGVEKSLEQKLKSKDNVKKALEVSEFLDELVKGLSSVIDGQGEKLSKSIKATSESNELLAKSFAGIVTTQKAVIGLVSDMNKSLLDMGDKIKHLEAQPLVRKSVSNAHVVEKSFAGTPAPVTNRPAAGGTTLSKSEASARLTAAVEAGNKAMIPELLALEGTGTTASLSPAAMNIINGK